jgi:lon-related putative ATP-dependent protease
MLVKSSGQIPAQSLVASLTPLTPDRLRRPADLSQLSFQSTAELDPIDTVIGQDRALDAVSLGMRIDKPGYNLFVIGPPAVDMQSLVKRFLGKESPQKKPPSDWVYVNNFADPHKPVAIKLPAGLAPEFRAAMDDLIEDLKTGLPAVFESNEYQARRAAVDERFQKKQAEAFAGLRDRAAPRHIVILHTPFGFALAPERGGKAIGPDEFHTWPDEEKKQAQQAINELEKELEGIIRQTPQWDKSRRDEIRTLNRETANIVVGQFIDAIEQRFSALPRVVAHLEATRTDLVDNAGMFLSKEKDDEGEAVLSEEVDGLFDRYRVNVFVTHEDGAARAIVVEEAHPTFANLIGRIEYQVQEGMLVSNFLMIKPGALHRANGGYLLLDVRSLILEPFSWSALKRVLLQQRIRIEDVTHVVGLTSAISLEPDPIPMSAKVVLFGDRLLYFLLAALDPDLEQHFKVLADFEDDTDRTPKSEALMARLIAAMTRDLHLRPFDREAVALIVEYAARLAEHGEKLSLFTSRLRDLLTEAEFCAAQTARDNVSRADVQRAIDRRVYRMARVRDRIQESINQHVKLIDTAGVRVGQVNGLSVVDLGGFAFGTASRITCRVRPGSGKVVDIEREVELGGPFHSKGVLILSGFLAGRYALDTTMSLHASLVFEQSYSGVEGDSASSAELYALLSAISELPLRQDLAITGSVNQHGEVQPIGGINEKIEGFFDICNGRSLTGTQGVMIPAANIQHLMLRQDVVDASANGKFAIYPVKSIDEGIALLSSRESGERGSDGVYPEGTVNRLVEDRLKAFAAVQRRFLWPREIAGPE